MHSSCRLPGRHYRVVFILSFCVHVENKWWNSMFQCLLALSWTLDLVLWLYCFRTANKEFKYNKTFWWWSWCDGCWTSLRWGRLSRPMNYTINEGDEKNMVFPPATCLAAEWLDMSVTWYKTTICWTSASMDELILWVWSYSLVVKVIYHLTG